MKTLLNKKTAAALALCLSMSVSTFGQSQVIHLTQNKATVSSIIKAIEKQTQMSVDFSQNTINLNKTVSLKSKSETLGELMNQILKGNGNLTYKIVDRHIIIVKAGHNGAQPERLVRQGVGKTKITGRVLDNNGEPIIGASVVEQGTKNGTVTDIDGNFVLNSSKENPTLDISYIGFISQQVKARSGATTNVTMKENAQSLEELVVVGYGSQKKVNVIGSIATVDSKSLEARSASDVSNMLTGQMSGVTITQTSGNPGQDGGTIRVRGVGSFGATPSPLVLVDGMPGSLSDLSPDEIENISVLKDASSAAIYGSRAANGVVLVTTKRGKEGRTKVSYNGSVGFSKAAELPEMAHSYDYAKFYNMAIGTDTYTAEDIFAFFQEGNIQKWQMEECWNMNPTNRYPKYPRLEVMSNAGSNNTLLSDYWILDASFVKVRNIQFGYKLPKNIISKAGISSMRAYISMDNPFSFKGYRKGWDPENTNNRGSYYPVMSSYTFGLTLAF